MEEAGCKIRVFYVIVMNCLQILPCLVRDCEI